MSVRDMHEPKEIVAIYYKALYTGDLSQVKKLMTWEAYCMTLESFGLKLALKDAAFKSKLKKLETPEVLESVESKLSQELVSRDKNPQIEIKTIELNGPGRQSVYFEEDGKDKILHFSNEKEGWKINYYAGRKLG